MTHPLVNQLRFTRSEFKRCMEGVSPEDAQQRLKPLNCISWIIGHLASQEHNWWVIVPQAKNLAPGLNDLVGWGKPASTPPLVEMWSAWQTITSAADEYLDTLNSESLQSHQEWKGKRMEENVGIKLLRNIYHYWFHTGEAHAIRQSLGHTDLPQFVGDISEAVYRPEV
ncbi:MAG: DUF664 domain-containing protein [Chloroflexi bacterium]|nr:DUF664 domain-containing protein [Chloroflexota bacterium]